MSFIIYPLIFLSLLSILQLHVFATCKQVVESVCVKPHAIEIQLLNLKFTHFEKQLVDGSYFFPFRRLKGARVLILAVLFFVG